MLWSSSAHAEIDPNIAIKAIVGEAEGESYRGKLAIAEALRNRGHVRGVYGVSSPRLSKAPKWVWVEAEKAWKESANTNLVKGADHWESTDFKVPTWAKKMTKTAIIGKHVFYRGGK